MQSTTSTDAKPGDAVRFAFPAAGGAEFFGTCEGHTEHQGRPAMLIRVAGFPAWIHTAPIDLVEPAPQVPTLYQRVVSMFTRDCTGNCNQGRNCTCQREADTVPGAL